MGRGGPVTGGTAALPPTPSQTVGPFFGHALPFAGGGDLAPAGHPGAVTVHGRVHDGAGRPVPDAIVELWQNAPEGRPPRAPGSLARRDGDLSQEFTGFGRVATDADGRWSARTLPPGARGGHAPHVSVCVFARGLLHHLFTRLYLPDDRAALAADPLLASLDPARRATLVAKAEPLGPARRYRFDIHLQGEKETVFLDLR
ncbi:protocatechuate 3,4-dioxygenase subunit alpha [Streptomyces sp. PT12]|uniref:protocatechuate 3,4-dioxygenase subunit alpha n=1 Tax=Streptomyces sp. PT12 TaxID=1510197 RepID=UPI000DE3B916|nr:protocatechuate 3,4-dioxygenase subunit alpha [Streptomyces sp. PT12]RBM06293.1 protocatechuate 3,4-dioxygenase subunit alpha [Streptomyces sp. PT12]